MAHREPPQHPRISVLIVDDKAAAREALKAILETDPEIEVIATACDPRVAADRLRRRVPDVITLELDLARPEAMHCIELLLRDHPIPLVVCSHRTVEQSRSELAALGHAAAAVIEKPREQTAGEWTAESLPICAAVRTAAGTRSRTPSPDPGVHTRQTRANTVGAARTRARTTGSITLLTQPMIGRSRTRTTGALGTLGPAARLAAVAVPGPGPKLSATAMLPVLHHDAVLPTTEQVIAIGASTGGTDALLAVLRALPADAPGIVIVQHMPERFTGQFADRLNAHCAITVREAVSGDTVVRGQALVAPGNFHLLLRRSGPRYYVEVKPGPLINRHRPSVDVLFRSTARAAGPNAIGVLLTGMGDDGARGMLELKQAGAYTVAQNEATCVVFGMPAEAIKRGGVDRVLPLDQIAADVVPRRH